MKNPIETLPSAGDPRVAREAASWTRWERTWVGLVALLFSSTGSLKLYSGLAAPAHLNASEKVFDLPMSDWSLAAGVVELVWVAILISSPGPGVGLAIARFLFGTVLAYRGLLQAFGGGYCGCLGGLLSETPWQTHEGLVLGGLAAIGFVVNEGCLALRRRRSASAGSSSPSRLEVRQGGPSRSAVHSEPDLWT